jgi:hypothetical protein
MASNYDIFLKNNDCGIDGGDFINAASDDQHIIDTINAFPGWWKQNPADGIGIAAWQKGAAQIQELSKQLRLQLTSDGYTLTAPTVVLSPDGQFIITPNASL